MRLRHLYFLIVLLLAASCSGGEQPAAEHHPAIRLELEEAGAFRATVKVLTVDAVKVEYGLSPDMGSSQDAGNPSADRISIQVSGLQPLQDYTFYARAIGAGGEVGAVQSIGFRTTEGPAGLYYWEAERPGVPAFADMTLVTLGLHNSNPPAWTPERFASHVEYTDASGKPHWLFDSFLCIDGWDPVRNLSFSITDSRYSAVKASWEYLLDSWLGDDGALKVLDSAIENATARLGNPPAPRYVIMSLPDPIRFQYFHDKSSPTVYWGDIAGVPLNFSRTSDQVLAYKWYMDKCRERFNALEFKHLELAGFYILSEELPLDPAFYESDGGYGSNDYATWPSYNWQYKNWEILIPEVSSYAHSCVEGLWWIPYHRAPGYTAWRKLGFDNIFMQPNYYWDHDDVSHPLNYTVNALDKYRMGMEMEFEYSLVEDVMKDGRSGPDGSGNPTFYLKDVPLLRSRVREYMKAFKDSGMYGVAPLAVYSGTDAMHQLASSKDEDDIAMYRDLCEFILDSPLKK